MVTAFKKALLLVCKWFLSFSSRNAFEMEVHGALTSWTGRSMTLPVPILPKKGSHMRPMSRRAKTGKSGYSHLKFHLCWFFSSPKGVHAMEPQTNGLVPGDGSTDLVRRRWRKRRKDTTELCNRTVHPAGPCCRWWARRQVDGNVRLTGYPSCIHCQHVTLVSSCFQRFKHESKYENKFNGFFCQEALFFCGSNLKSLWARPDSLLTLGIELTWCILFFGHFGGLLERRFRGIEIPYQDEQTTCRTLEGSWVDCNAMSVARLEVNKAALKTKAQRLVRSSWDGGNIHHCGFFIFLFQKEGGSPDLKKIRCSNYWVVATQIFFIFIPTWERFPCWLIFFKWVETTN